MSDQGFLGRGILNANCSSPNGTPVLAKRNPYILPTNLGIEASLLGVKTGLGQGSRRTGTGGRGRSGIEARVMRESQTGD
jgi:hypothetical protein